MTDLELLGQYGRTKAQDAFGELVRRHVDWVYSAAVRQVRDRQLAEDVTQAVFIALARRAGALHGDRPLSSWLMTVTRCAAINAVRAESRRRRHEQEAAAMRQETSAAEREAGWEEIAPVLDEQVLRLRQKDRDAVMLRFYERRSFAEVGQVLGISEEAARKRVERAVEQLRARMVEKGVTVGAGSLGALVGAKLVEQTPARLVQQVMAGGGAATGAGLIAKGALGMMAWTKVKVAAGVVAVAVVAGVGAGMAGGGATIQQTPAATPVASTQAGPAALPTANVSAGTVQVLLPDGTPAAGAEVYLSLAGARGFLTLFDPVSRLGKRGPSSQPTAGVFAGADGRFTLPAGEPPVRLVIVHAGGVAEVMPQEVDSGRVMLQAWGRIEGQLSASLRTGTGQKAHYRGGRDGAGGFRVWYEFTAPVDAEGRFGFDRVPPGHGVVSRVMPLTRGRTESEFHEHGVPVDVGAGGAATIAVGGTGVAVRGQVEPPAGSEWKLADTYAYVQLKPIPEGRAAMRPNVPEEVKRMDPAQQRAWFEGWLKGPEGQAVTAEQRAFALKTEGIIYANGIRGDGVFDLVEVPPGKYQLRVTVSAVYEGPGWGTGKRLGWLSREVTVPNGDAGQVVGLGQLLLEVPKEAGR